MKDYPEHYDDALRERKISQPGDRAMIYRICRDGGLHVEPCTCKRTYVGSNDQIAQYFPWVIRDRGPAPEHYSWEVCMHCGEPKRLLPQLATADMGGLKTPWLPMRVADLERQREQREQREAA